MTWYEGRIVLSLTALFFALTGFPMLAYAIAIPVIFFAIRSIVRDVRA